VIIEKPSTSRTPSLLLRCALLLTFVLLIRSLLIPIALGAIFAVLLTPWCKSMKNRLGRVGDYAPMIMTSLTMILVMLPLVFVAVQAIAAVPDMMHHDVAASMSQVSREALIKMEAIGREMGVDSLRVRQILAALGTRVGTTATEFASSSASALPGYILDIFLFVVALYYLLRDGRRFLSWLRRVSPFSEPDTDELFVSVNETIHGAILGTIAVALVQGGMTLIALLALQIPGAFLWAVLAALCSFIPMVGTAPVTLGATIYLAVTGRPTAALAMGIIGVVVGLSDNIVRPWAQSSRGGMHPLLALMAIFGGLEMFGPFGIFLGPVVAAMGMWAVDTYAHRAKQDNAPMESSGNIVSLARKGD